MNKAIVQQANSGLIYEIGYNLDIWCINLIGYIHQWLFYVAAGDQPSDAEVKQLLQDVEKYTLASHLSWGLWGIISVICAYSE